MAPKKRTARIPKRSDDSTTVTASDPVTHPLRHEGPLRPYHLTTNDHYNGSIQLGKLDIYCALGLFLFCLSLRISKLGDFDYIVNESEFSFVSAIYRYGLSQHYNDTAPPFSKLLYFFVAKFLGFDATIGSEVDYKVGFPMYGLRFFNVLLSSSTVAALYAILRKSGVSLVLSNLVCVMFSMENLFALESRFISSGNLQILFLAVTALQLVTLQTEKEFSCTWLRSLAVLAVTVGFSLATSWETIYTIVWLVIVFGLRFLESSQDLSITNRFIFKQYFLKVQSLLTVPVVIYLLTFVLHIGYTSNYHIESSLLSTAFQRSKIGHPFGNSSVPEYVPFDSTVTLVHEDSLGGYLHSHPYNYKTGSLEQQVTVYDYLDFNNEWVIEPANPKFTNKFEPRIRDGSMVKLRHKLTGKLLSVNAEKKPPISEQEYDFEVSCVGNATFAGSKAEEFRIIFLSSEEADPGSQFLQTGSTRFSLQNPTAACHILSHDLKLPEWGFGQQEVICIKEPNPARHVFFVEDVKYLEKHLTEPKLQNTTISEAPPLYKKIFELNQVIQRLMVKSQEVKKTNSAGFTWLSNKTQFLATHDSTRDTVHYAIGNGFNFNIVILALVLSTMLLLKNLIFPGTNLVIEANLAKIQTALIGYLIHLIFRGESSLITDYKSSLLFGFILIGLVSQNFLYRLGKAKETWVYGIVGLVVVFSYFRYYQIVNLTLGLNWNKKECLDIFNAGYFDEEYICDLYKK
ncbi:hypothetical protein WICPIJ_006893 [Wickerhamomyces pijperi]|uniref:Dolichyl-phosphate-mannose--protein mannosyltransferase n=1 Tax=Wickerhamomyces pijperi TaxID=599730 RepID=A0A9P8Q2P1_WICPI|nr:hypothetical protein WICPIJ_006893 [Wickerhamomyces pijperi]